MNPKSNPLFVLALLLSLVSAGAGHLSAAPPPESPLIIGLDHLPLAVRDLDQASRQYRRLGFVLKPGRPHRNGIRNMHVKLPDGSGIELITAAQAVDPMTAQYLRFLDRGDGPAFVGFYAPEMTRLAWRLEEMGIPHQRQGGLLTFPPAHRLSHLFFGQRPRSSTDRPLHFRHPNTARALVRVWLAGDDLKAEQNLLAGLGAIMETSEVNFPHPQKVPLARLPEAEILFLPGSWRLVPGRPLAGATLLVRDLKALQQVLAQRQIDPPPIRTTKGLSLILPPTLTHGLWLEFMERP